MSKIYVDEIHPKTTGKQVLMPEKPMFLLKKTAGDARTVQDSWQTIDFDEATYDVGNNCSVSNNTFTVPVDGYYQLNYNMRVDNMGSSYFITAVSVNDNFTDREEVYHGLYSISGSPNSGIYMTMQNTMLAKLYAGDVLRLKYYSDSDTSYTIQAQTTFSGFLVG